MTEDFSSGNKDVRRQWPNIFQQLKENCQPRVLCPARIFSRNEEKNKNILR